MLTKNKLDYNSVLDSEFIKYFVMFLYVLQSHSYDEANKAQKNVFDLESFVGDLNVEEDACRYVHTQVSYSCMKHTQYFLLQLS